MSGYEDTGNEERLRKLGIITIEFDSLEAGLEKFPGGVAEVIGENMREYPLSFVMSDLSRSREVAMMPFSQAILERDDFSMDEVYLMLDELNREAENRGEPRWKLGRLEDLIALGVAGLIKPWPPRLADPQPLALGSCFRSPVTGGWYAPEIGQYKRKATLRTTFLGSEYARQHAGVVLVREAT